jgi:hypothetical protein
MGNLLNMAIKMQDPVATTTTTTTASTKTVNWSYDNGGCTGRSGSIIKNSTSIFTGTGPSSGSFTVVPGDVITVTDTTGIKATGFICTNASALIGSTLGGGEYASNTATGQGVTATATYTIITPTAATIYMQGGPNFA